MSSTGSGASASDAGLRRSALHNLTYADFCKVANQGCEVHGDGMIWAGALWDLRESLLALEPSAGRDTFEHLVVQGMKSAACTPTFLVARDALLKPTRRSMARRITR